MQVKQIMKMEQDYPRKQASKVKKIDEDARCYYMNATYKNVLSSRYCIKTQSKSILDSKYYDHALPLGE